MNINWLLNSMADAGTISLGGLWLMWQFSGKNLQIFQQWNWPAFQYPFDMVHCSKSFCGTIFVS